MHSLSRSFSSGTAGLCRWHLFCSQLPSCVSHDPLAGLIEMRGGESTARRKPLINKRDESNFDPKCHHRLAINTLVHPSSMTLFSPPHSLN